MQEKIEEYENFFSAHDSAFFVQMLFDRKALWEDRTLKGEKPVYRNGRWYTLGASIYTDLTKPEDLAPFIQKTHYFNTILEQNFAELYTQFLTELNKSWDDREFHYLSEVFHAAPLPGFHIFPPEETLQAPFGHVHRDLQWQALVQIPQFPFPAEKLEHFTFTLPLVLPYQGGGMFLPEEDRMVDYKERALYFHSGQFPHQVVPLKPPVTPLDWRITFQGHGFNYDGKSYLYW